MPTPSSIGSPGCPPRRAALTASTRPRLASLLSLCVLSMPALVRAAEGGAPASREIDLLSGPLDRVAPWPWKHFSGVASKGLSDVWELREGVLVCRGTPKGYLWLDRDLADFKLRLEWRWPSGKAPGSAGVLFRTTEPHRIWPRSLEAQLNAGQAGDFWGLGGFPLDGPAERKTVVEHPDLGRLTNLKRTETLEKPPGEWNLYEIEAKGATATLRINGREVNRATGCDARAGKICLTSEGDEVHFRNVRLIVEESGEAPLEGGPHGAGGGTRPAGTDGPGKPRPLPTSVRHERLASGEHEYTVRGLYPGPKEGDGPDVVEASKYEIEAIPGCTRFVIDRRARTATFRAREELEDLPSRLDELARGAGVFPYWTELETRDLRSARFEPGLFRLAVEREIALGSLTGQVLRVSEPRGRKEVSLTCEVFGSEPRRAVDVTVRASSRPWEVDISEPRQARASDLEGKPRGDPAKVSIRYARELEGTARLNRTTAFCMAHDRFALRIFDAEGRYVWEDLDHAYGNCWLLATDLDRVGAEEVVLAREDHGKTASLVFERAPAHKPAPAADAKR